MKRTDSDRARILLLSDLRFRIHRTESANVHIRGITSALGERAELLVPKCRFGMAILGTLSNEGRPTGLARLAEAFGLVVGTLEILGFALRHRADFAYVRHAFWMAPAIVLLRVIRVPVVLELNGLVTTERQQASDVDRSATIAESFELAIISLASKIRCVSAFLSRELIDAGIAPDKIFVRHNGVDERVFENASEQAPTRGLVGFIGSGHRWHSLPTLLEAFADVVRKRPTAKLMVVGPKSETLERELTRLDLASHVELRGPISHAEAITIFEQIEIAVNPGSAPHHSPLKLFEAMALGKAIVAGRAMGISEVLEQEKTALLVEIGNATDLSDAIVRLLDDGGLRDRLGRAARSEAKQSYTWQLVASAVLQAGASLKHD